jgi:hypothetical protein
MNRIQIKNYWQQNFPLCPPINYLFKIFYTDRWLRIHSLPSSKRYADTAAEWKILFETQNQILNDVFTENEEIIIFTGVYSNSKITFEENNLGDNAALKQFEFQPLDKIDLYAMTKDYCEEDTFYTPYFTSIIYKSNTYNELLKSIANDEIRAFFLNTKTNTIVAPYDGGIDIIFTNEYQRNNNLRKYNKFIQQQNYK